MPLSKDDLVEVVRKALLGCSGEFERTANPPQPPFLWGADRMPESWLLVTVMRAVASRGLAAFPEVRARHDFQFCKTNGKTWTPPPELMGARIDLLIGEDLGPEQRMRVRAALELKGPKSAWGGFPTDLSRLRGLAPLLPNDDQVRICGYVSPPMTNEGIANEISRYVKETGLTRDQFSVWTADTPSLLDGAAFPYVFLYTM